MTAVLQFLDLLNGLALGLAGLFHHGLSRHADSLFLAIDSVMRTDSNVVK